MSEKTTLSSNVCNSLPPGNYYDAKQAGLMFVVTANSRIWRYYGWLGGKPVKKTLGRFPDLPVPAARIAASEFATARRAEGDRAIYPKLGELAATYSNVCATVRKNRTDHMAESFRYWQQFANKRLDEIDQTDIQDAHDELATTSGPAAARRAVKALRTLYNFAIRRNRCRFNPATYVEIAGAVRRSVILDDAELAVFHRVVDQLGPELGGFFRLALLTGLRRANLLGLQASWINLEKGMITVPAEASKNKKVMVIPICPEAVVLLRGRLCRPFAVSDIGRAMNRLRQLMREHGVDKHFCLHDLRRTYAVQLTERGAPITVVAHALGHSSTTATPIYTSGVSVESVRKYFIA
jgi:integrase